MKKLSENYKVLKFGFFSDQDPSDMLFQHEICWSRIYEYPFVLQEIKSAGLENPKIHNCAWGSKDIHIVFKTCLDVAYKDVYHSDITPSTFLNTNIWDITKAPRDSLLNYFDIVLNISTLEHVHEDHRDVLENHLVQLNKGGLFIATFDLPGLQLENMQDYLGQKIKDCESRLNPINSKVTGNALRLPSDYHAGYLVIKRCS
jgi:hypothetical protein